MGLIADPNGNGLYWPHQQYGKWCAGETCFAYLPYSPVKEIPAENTGRVRLADGALPEGFQAAGYLMSVTVNNLREEQTLALRINGLSARSDDYTLFYEGQDGTLLEMAAQWTLCDAGGQPLDNTRTLEETQIYEIRFSIADGSELDRSEQAYQGAFRVVLAGKQS